MHLNFIQKCVLGVARSGDIDIYIDEWHANAVQLPIHTFLGMTHEEYERWVKDNNELGSIIKARHEARKSGRTTRIIDMLVQELFLTGSCTVRDHYIHETTYRQQNLLRDISAKLANRLRGEHGLRQGAGLEIDLEKLEFKLAKA